MNPCANPGCKGFTTDARFTKCPGCLMGSPMAIENEKRKAALAAKRKRRYRG